MPIYVSVNYNGYVEDIILAESKSLAIVYWQGKGIYPYTTRKYTEEDLKDHITGVIPILSTYQLTASKFGGNPQDFVAVSKNR